MAENDIILEAQGLRKTFGPVGAQVEALRGLDLRVRRGEFLAVMGPSGCGKSTLLHVLGLLTPPDVGHVLLDGEPVSGLPEKQQAMIRRTRTGFVFQRFNLIGTLSGYDNVLLSLRIRGRGGREVVDPLLEAMGVASAAQRKPGRMSIGQQQRIAIARAVAHRPDLLLADEPTGNLDSRNTQAILDLLIQENRQRGQTIVMITHAPAVAQAAGRIAHMQDGVIVDETKP